MPLIKKNLQTMYYRLIGAILLLPFFGHSQINTCGNLMLESSLEHRYEGYRDAVINTLTDVKESTSLRDGDTLTIPVVVHLIYNADAENLSDQLILDQIAVLNQDFSRTNPDVSNTRDIFSDVAGTAHIQFELAGIDPDGQPTPGITRRQTSVSSFIEFDFAVYLQALVDCGVDIFDPESIADNIDCITERLDILELDKMKSQSTGGTDPWDVNKYLNIWICNMSIDLGGNQTPFILGFAYPPMNAPNWPSDQLPDDYAAVDGVVLHYEAVGPNNPAAGQLAMTNNRGRTATHEVGHYLGLRHIWGDGDCSMDDFMSDTPPAGTNSQSDDIQNLPTCEELQQKDSCTDDALPDMIENYMDYSIESCQNMFTNEQVTLMRQMLLGPRSSLLESNVLTDTPDIQDETLTLYPTLTSGIINISKLPDTNLSYQVLGVNGVTHLINTDLRHPVIDISALDPGIYFVRVTIGQQSTLTRVVKY